MPITWRPNGRRVDIVFVDAYTREEAEDVMKEIYGTPRIPRPLRFLVDVRQTAAPDAEFVVNAITFWQMHVHDMWDARVAVVASTSDQMEMAHISEASVEGRELPFRVRSFQESEWQDAERWLAEPE